MVSFLKLNQLLDSDSISKKYITEIEIFTQLEGLEDFFELENKLLYQIQQVEKDQAKKTLQLLIEQISLRAGKRTIRAVKHYFIILSSIMARKLYENQVPFKKTFAFNTACIDMVDNHLNDASFLQFADDLIDFFVSVISERKQPTFSHRTVNKVILYINDEVETELSVEEIAKYFQVSTSHLSRIFREHVGITLVEYLNVRRVEESQYYLRHTNKSILAISKQYHFCNQSYFTRIFKKYTEVTPKQFRDQKEHKYFRFGLSTTV
ncbi:AraC family transcriptional regulator [Paenisporosarcina antarctica]|uniref:AraC family transcriptional regulator n=1 Tax=Paenisporosarcina antarctica TaxID=417367 RepID=A0A4V1AMP7_9BACL|nr:helix-turn-helix domain-containing protein [Paenisporosarcina antarctica]QBP40015.1 AraC family transcriptional regulator [Paenisporosarcina antarctica]